MSSSGLKHVDKRTKYVVFGYCRSYKTNNIPLLVQYLCIAYYWIQEKFTVHGDQINVDVSNKIKGCNDCETAKYNTTYGNKIIDINDKSINTYQWTFKLLNMTRREHNIDLPICIGIDASME
eukprot:287087_1